MPPTLTAATDNGVGRQFQPTVGEVQTQPAAAVERGESAQGAPGQTGGGVPSGRPPGALCAGPERRAPALRDDGEAGALVFRRGRGPGLAQAAFLIAEMSKVSFTLSLTMTPPVSRAAFQVRPHSERRISAEPSKPTRSLP